MSKSAQLRCQDVRALIKLVGECRDLGDDPFLWRQHWFEQVAQLTGSDLIVGGEFAGLISGQPRAVGTTEWGWRNGFDRNAWLRALLEFGQVPTFSEMLVAYFSRLHEEDGPGLSRTELVEDKIWYRSSYYLRIHGAIGVDHTLQCFRSLPGAPDEFNSITLARAIGEPDFKARDKIFVREANAAIAPLVGGALARFNEPSPADLAPRLREVLNCLLEGEGDKQIASRLGISRYTVNQYVKQIFLHFRVSSRQELLARWVRRGKGLPPIHG